MAANQPPHEFNVSDEEMQQIVGDAINFEQWFEICKRHHIFTAEGEQAGQQVVDLYGDLIRKGFRLYTDAGRREVEEMIFEIHFRSLRIHFG